jgi:hypothetical protein
MIIVPKNINAAQSFRVGPLIINNNKFKKNYDGTHNSKLNYFTLNKQCHSQAKGN